MKHIKSLLTLLALFGIVLNGYSESDVAKGERIARQNDQQPKFQKMKGETALNIYGNDGKLKFKKVLIIGQYIENMGKENEIEKSMSYMKSPADERGNAYMALNYKNKPDVKIVYLKGIRKAKKVAGATKKSSFFGSDFYINDMGYPDISECNYKYLGKEKVQFKGKPFECLVVEATPKTDKIKSETGYGRKVSYMVPVTDKSFLTLKLDYYDENLKKIKVLSLLSFLKGKNVRGETVFFTTSLEMKNVQRGTKTILEMQNMKFEKDADLRTDIFTEQYLTRRWW